ncbi:MAG: EAL domain-containing protein [Desulfuromonadaceae bacterium]|nr:EAL domain-containing protein [Desulfuromonadaceae bacterium]
MLRARITTINLLYSLFSTLFLAGSVGYFLIVRPLQSQEAEFNAAREVYVEQQKEQVRDNVHSVLSLIESSHQQARNRLDEELRSLAVEAQSMVASLGQRADVDIVLKEFLRHLQWQHKNYCSVMISAGGDVLYQRSSADAHSAQALFSHVSAESILRAVQQSDAPLSLQLTREPYHVVAAWLPEINQALILAVPETCVANEVQMAIFSYLAKVRFGEGDYGYYFVIDENQEKPLLIAIRPTPFRRDGEPLPVLSGNAQLIEGLKTAVQSGGEGFYRYTYANPARQDQLEEKISFVARYPVWNWIVGTGFYLSDLETGFSAIEQRLKAEREKKILGGVVLLVLNLIFSLFLASWINRHINKLEQQRQAEMHELEQYKKLIDLSCLVSKSDLAGNITYANEAFQQVSGYSLDEMLGKPHNLFRHPATPRAVFKGLWQTIQAGRVWRGETKNRAKDGSDFYTQQVIMPIQGRNGRIREYIAARHDITELLQKREQLSLAFSTDSLTALGSRFKLMQDVAALEDCACLILLDVISFHGINRLYGQEVGDRALVHTSKLLTQDLSDELTTCYRLNADVFAVLGRGDEAALNERIQGFLQRFPNALFYGDAAQQVVVPLALTAGMACVEENLLTCADIALKEAKRLKVQLFRYDPSSANREEYQEKMEIIDGVRQALNDGRILAYFQPIIDLESGKIVKFETLMRWKKPDGTIVAPGIFLPILKQTPYYVFMTHAIIEQSCELFRDKPCCFSVNFSVDDLLRKETVQLLVDTMQRYGVSKRLVLEVVETENIHNYDEALATLHYLKQLGCRISIDDFGSGYANFSYLTQVQADVIKIDGSLVQAVNKDEKTRELISSIVRFAHNSGMKVVAEFVDSEELAITVKEIGCDFAQGYLYSPPLPRENLPECAGMCESES